MMVRAFAELDWRAVKLVVFDVDGTLYRQRTLRLLMLRELLQHCIMTATTMPARVLSTYRSIRETLGDAEVEGFEPLLIARTARETGCSHDTVESIVSEWIEHRPLRHLASCRYPLLPELFSGLKLRGKIVGILSDYPARGKMHAIGLVPDYVVAAGDPEVGVLKPHPRGLQVLMAAAGADAAETVVIGDRPERDGAAAARAGTAALIRSSKPIRGWHTFAAFDDPVFAPFLRN